MLHGVALPADHRADAGRPGGRAEGGSGRDPAGQGSDVKARAVWVAVPTLVAILPSRTGRRRPIRPQPGCDTARGWPARPTCAAAPSCTADYVYDDYCAQHWPAGLVDVDRRRRDADRRSSATRRAPRTRRPAAAAAGDPGRPAAGDVPPQRALHTPRRRPAWSPSTPTPMRAPAVARGPPPTRPAPAGTWPVCSTPRPRASPWDTVANTITGSMPLPGGTSWRVQAVHRPGRRHRHERRVPGSSAESGPWFENRQAADLQAGDISEFGYPVTVSDLTAGVTRLESVPPGVHERVYQSAYTVGSGEGMTLPGCAGHAERSAARADLPFPRPLSALTPSTCRRPPGRTDCSSSCTASAAASTIYSAKLDFASSSATTSTGSLVAPLGRGPTAGTSVLPNATSWTPSTMPRPATRSTTTRRSSRATRWVATGVYRIAELYPDRFAGLLDWVGYTDCLNGTPLAGVCPIFADDNPLDYVANLRWVPGGLLLRPGRTRSS